MNEQRTYPQLLRRVLLPLLIAGSLIVATVLFSGSALIRIEDVYVNRIVAGTYGSPDWRVQEMNPLLAQILSLLYRVIPSVNWYGVLLLALLFLASATLLHFAARQPGGLLPAAILVGPIVLLSANSVISTVVCAFSASAGVIALMNGLQRKKDGIHQTVYGAVLAAVAISLSMKWGLIVSAGVLLCSMPGMARENRMRGFLAGLPTLAIIAAALFGYSTLMYSAPELSAYRENYALYERLQHSELREESDRLIQAYGVSVYSDDASEAAHEHAEGDEHDHDHEEHNELEHEESDGHEESGGDAEGGGQVEVGTQVESDGSNQAEENGNDQGRHEDEDDISNIAQPPSTVFASVGWSLNDSSLFFKRFAADLSLTDPDTLRALSDQADTISLDLGRLVRELFETVKKPQFLLLIALLLIAGLGLILTRRRKGLVVLLAAAIAFGGHIFALLSYYNAYADIAPFYLLAIASLLYHFNGEDAKKWFHERVKARLLRLVLTCGAVLVFCAALAGLLYYTSENPANGSPYDAQAYRFVTDYVAETEDMLFIGDNPNERYKPDTLEAPRQGADRNLLAGSYDLYSPRAKEQMARFGIENPLIDCINREDIGYVKMSFTDTMVLRLAENYDIYLKDPVELASHPELGEQIYRITSYSEEEFAALLAEKAAEKEQAEEFSRALEKVMAQLEADGLLDNTDNEEHGADDLDGSAGE